MANTEQALGIIRHALQTAKAQPCIFFNGDMPSMLVLHLLRQMDPNIPVVAFIQDFTKEQWGQFEQLILKWNLTIYTAPASNRFFMPDEDGLALVDEHHWAGVDLPVIRKMKHGEQCGLDLSADRSLGAEAFWAAIFTGSLKDHAVTQKEHLTFIAPLTGWSKNEVTEYAYSIGLEEIKGVKEISACTRCLENQTDVFCVKEKKMIPPVIWDQGKTSEAFRKKYSYGT